MGRRSIWAVIGAGIAAFCRGCVGACVWCIRMMWNAFCICTSVLVGMLGVCFLFAFGMLAILVIGGYPLGGAVIGVLGATVSFFAAAGFVMTLLWRKKRPVPAAAPADAVYIPEMKPRRKRSIRSGKPVQEVQTESEEGPADRMAEAVRIEPDARLIAEQAAESIEEQVTKPAAAQNEGPAAAPSTESFVEPAVSEETEANSREEEKGHA